MIPKIDRLTFLKIGSEDTAHPSKPLFLTSCSTFCFETKFLCNFTLLKKSVCEYANKQVIKFQTSAVFDIFSLGFKIYQRLSLLSSMCQLMPNGWEKMEIYSPVSPQHKKFDIHQDIEFCLKGGIQNLVFAISRLNIIEPSKFLSLPP